jgi:hypothetical protein
MLQTNLIGRWFKDNLGGRKFRVEIVYNNGGNLWIVGINDKGALIHFNPSQVTLITEN